MNKLTLILTLILTALFAGCSSHHSSPVAPDSSGVVSSSSQVQSSSSGTVAVNRQFIKLTKLNGSTALAKRAAFEVAATTTSEVTDSQVINNGPIKATTQSLYLPINTTKGVLQNLTFTSSNPAFEISPRTISAIGIPGQSVETMPILSITAIHGTASSGTGFAMPLMRESNSSTQITITGTYVDSADTVQFTTTYTMKVTPRYVSFKTWKRQSSYVLQYNFNGSVVDTIVVTPASTTTNLTSGCGIIDTTATGCHIRAVNVDTINVAAGDTLRFRSFTSDCVIDPAITPSMNSDGGYFSNSAKEFCDAPGDAVILDPAHQMPASYASFPVLQ